MYSPNNSALSKTNSDSPSLRRRSLQLPTPMRVEVRSSGFSSRLSALVRENSGGNTSPFKAKRLQPPLAAAAFNPKYQGFGSLPRVKLERRSLPRLSAKNSPSMVKSPASRGEFWIMIKDTYTNLKKRTGINLFLNSLSSLSLSNICVFLEFFIEHRKHDL